MDFQIRPAQGSEAVAKPSATILLHSLGAKRLLMTRTGHKDIWCQPIVPVRSARWRLLALTRSLQPRHRHFARLDHPG